MVIKSQLGGVEQFAGCQPLLLQALHLGRSKVRECEVRKGRTSPQCQRFREPSLSFDWVV